METQITLSEFPIRGKTTVEQRPVSEVRYKQVKWRTYVIFWITVTDTFRKAYVVSNFDGKSV